MKTHLYKLLAWIQEKRLEKHMHKTAQELHEIRSYGLNKALGISESLKRYKVLSGACLVNNNQEAV